jgi:hypothetical protein
MMASGLERKCDIQAYVCKVDALCDTRAFAEQAHKAAGNQAWLRAE